MLQLIKCLAENNSIDLILFESQLTVPKAMDSMTLGKLSRGIEKINVIKAITYLVLRFADTLNVRNGFTEEQASVLALDLTEIFEYDTLEDVVLMFKYARQGKLGKVYERLDPEFVTGTFVPNYLELKAIERESNHSRTKGELNGMSNFKWDKEDVKKFNVDEKLVNPTKLGQRMREKIEVVERPQVILKDRKQFLDEMLLQVKRMSDDQLKAYLTKCDVNNPEKSDSIPYDQAIFEMVEDEIDSRSKK